MNNVTLIGRLVKNPELKFSPNTGTAVTDIVLAVDRRVLSKNGQREADFIPVVIWGKQAETTATYVGKGKLFGVRGRIQTRSYDAKDGTKRYVTEIVAEEIQILEWANSGENRQSGGQNKENNQQRRNNNQQGNVGGNENSGNADGTYGSGDNYDYYGDMTPAEDGDIPF